MSRKREDIDRVRAQIASVVYNDGLPTPLVTSSLVEICFQYENYMKASESQAGGSVSIKQTEALKAIRASVDLLNRQNRLSGASYDILFPKDNSLESMRDLGETIAVIYAIPYKAKEQIDYVGYAYGTTLVKMRNDKAYEVYGPDDYINKCSFAILDNANQRESREIIRKMKDCADAFDYYRQIESGEIAGNIQDAQNIMFKRVGYIAEEIESVSGSKPDKHIDTNTAKMVSSCIRSSFKFSDSSVIEEFREEGIFKDTAAMNRMAELQKGDYEMATTNNELIHTNLVNLTGRLAGGVPEGEIHDDLSGLAAMAGNEGEAAAADMIQTLSFTTWIKDICDGYKQEKELDVGTPEYNENAKVIRECVQNINNLGHKMGIEGDVIPTPQSGKEGEVASAVYNDFALPYEAGAQVDYSKYMQMKDGPQMKMKTAQPGSSMAQTQELGQQMQRAMRRLNTAIAMSPQYGTHAQNYWNAVQKAASSYNARCGEFLDSMDSLEDYERQFDEAKGFLAKEEEMSTAGMSDFQMGGAAADKIDFEGDDGTLQANLRETIAKAEKLIKTERAMLKGGHIDSKRRALFEQTLKGYIKEMKGEQADIEADNAADIQATAELEQQMKEKPHEVTEENARKYYEMVEKQQTMGPNLHMTDLEKMARVAALGIGAMNATLIATGVTPIGLNMASAVAVAKVGKFAYDMNKFMNQEHAPEAKVKEASLSKGIDLDKVPEYKGHKEKTEDEPTIDEPEASVSKKFAMAVKRKAADFAERMRTAIREHMTQFDENATDYEANEQFKETIEHFIGTTVDENGNIIAEPVSAANQSKNLVGLDSAMVMGTGEHVFDKDPQEMTDDELKVYSAAVVAVMAPMKDENGKYLPNFSDCYAVGEEVMPEAQQEYTDATTSLMVVGQPDAALAVRESQTELIACSTEYQQLSDDSDLTHVEDDSAKYADVQNRADAADERARHMMDVYKPLIMKAGIMAGAAAYQKHEYNKAWKESIRERNLQLMCQGTIQSMEKSAQENHMLNHERLYGQHGLLRA